MKTRNVLALAAGLLTACGGGGGGGEQPAPTSTMPPPSPPNAAIEINGAVQKGPFLVGSTVLINRLDTMGRPTAKTIVTQVEDSIGSFEFVSDEPGPVQIVATGYYFSELTGQISNGTLTLRALYAITNQPAQSASVNILTHLINDRVIALLAEGAADLSAAIAQAERELVEALMPVLPVASVDRFSGLSIYNGSPEAGASVGDVYLLALSAAFYKYAATQAEEFGTATDAELTLILNRLSRDLEEDGDIDEPGFIEDFVRAMRSLSPARIIENLRNRSLVDYSRGLGVPDISVFLDLCAGPLECAWRAAAPMPTTMANGAIAVFDGKIYIFGGVAVGPGSAVPDVYEYDPARNEWRARAPMPIASHDSDAHVIGDKIYVVAGYGDGGFRNELLEYTPATDQWRARAVKPAYMYQFASATVGGKIYVLGGEGPIDDGPPGGTVPWSTKDYTQIYDPVADSWSRGHAAPMTFQTWSSTCVYGGEIYVLGGRTQSGNSPVEPFVLTYDPAADSWSAKSPMTTPREGMSCAVTGDEFYLFGGRKPRIEPVDIVERYNPLQQTWSSPTRLPTGRLAPLTAVVGSEVFVFGGAAAPWPSGSDVVEVLDPSKL